MRLPDEPDLPPQINIVPMIDVIFAILTFFIVSTLYLTRSEGLPVSLPGAVTTQVQPQARIVVTLNRQGQLFLNRQPTQLQDLKSKVQSLITPNRSALVVINADKSASYGQFVTVMDQLRSIQGIRLAIGTERLQTERL
jgi:biopolymer transport protein ExbD